MADLTWRPGGGWGDVGDWPDVVAQDTEQGGDAPDVNRPVDGEISNSENELPEDPFTGEDVEDAGKPGPVPRRQDQSDN